MGAERGLIMSTLLSQKRCYVRAFDPARDYEAVALWWVDRMGAAIPANILPKCGVVACEELDGEAIAAGWIFMDNSVSVAMIEWLVTKPTLRIKLAHAALKAVVEMLEVSAKHFGYAIITGVTSRRMAYKARKHGFAIKLGDLCLITKGLS